MRLATTHAIAAMTIRTATSTDDRSQVLANRDPLTLISPTDRAQHALRFAVIRRSGEHAGSILFSEATLSAASTAAQALPGYRPQDYWVRFIPADEI